MKRLKELGRTKLYNNGLHYLYATGERVYDNTPRVERKPYEYNGRSTTGPSKARPKKKLKASSRVRLDGNGTPVVERVEYDGSTVNG